MLQYVVLIITLEVCVDSLLLKIVAIQMSNWNQLTSLWSSCCKPWESRVVGRSLDVVAGWGRSLGWLECWILLSPLDWYGFLGTLHGQRAADGRSKSVATWLRAVSTNGNFHGFWGTLHGQRAADGWSESVAAWLCAVSTNRKNSKCQIFSQEQKLGYLGSWWVDSLQILTQCSW